MEDDGPILLLMLNRAGIPIYSQSFAHKKLPRELLKGGFFYWMNSFISELFPEKGGLQIIRMKNSSITFKNLEHSSLWYFFRGSLMLVHRKLDSLFQRLRTQHSTWHKLQETRLYLKMFEKELIDLIVNDLCCQSEFS
ncbi:MAG: hypothetical protein IH840_04960 [Candidatus Heimdallarchaeota archaeon]|nr:hypothetical protein [Candidatus Heimdallarchaeota archaeon]